MKLLDFTYRSAMTGMIADYKLNNNCKVKTVSFKYRYRKSLYKMFINEHISDTLVENCSCTHFYCAYLDKLLYSNN